MSQAAGSFVSSTDRPLGLRMRSDLIVDQHRYLGRDYWVVKDPLSLKYFRFEEEEYLLLSMLDGKASLREIQERFERKFSPQRISFGELHRFMGTLFQNSLVVSDAAKQGQKLLERSQKQATKRRWTTLANLMSYRFKGFDPDRLLTVLNRYFGWLFSAPLLAASICLMLVAGSLILVQFREFQSRLPAFEDFFAAQNWIWLALTMAVTKVLHELGHGLTCKKLGGECHEMGVMFLVFTPCLYVNVSDSWMLPNKWKRAAIAAAGMYVELVLASICVLCWWFTNPGMLNYLCLNVIFVSSVSTIVFNANPLLKYDGYYILADLIEIPNLRQKASAVVQRAMSHWLLGIPPTDDPFLPKKRRWLFAVYAVAASCYRWLVVFSIFWFVYRMLEPYGLKIIGQILAFSALQSLVVMPMFQLYRFVRTPGRMSKVKPLRVGLSLSIATLVVAGILCIPLPNWVHCPTFVQPRQAESVYVDVSGRLAEVHVQPGDWVNVGDPIVTLVSSELRDQLIELEGDLALAEAKIQNARLQETYDPLAESNLDTLEQTFLKLQKQHANLSAKIELLTVRATAAGVVFPPPYRGHPEDDEELLPEWSGTPLEVENIGATMSAGVLLAVIGDRKDFEAILTVDQEQMESLRPGLNVEVNLRQLPATVFESEIEHIATSEMKEVPKGLAGQFGGPLVTEVKAGGAFQPQTPTYQVSVPLSGSEEFVPIGAIGRARIRVGSQTVGERLAHWAIRTFNFEL